MGKRLSGACSSSASCDACAMLFPGEPRANFRRRDLAAELGTPGRLWAVCSPGAGPATRVRSCEIERGAAGGSGRRPETEAGGGARCWEVPGVGSPAPALPARRL